MNDYNVGENKFLVYGESRAGVRHVNGGQSNQDYMTYFCGDNFLIGAVADGAGSLTFSGEGAKLACDEVVSYLKSHLDGEQASGESISDAVKEAIVHARQIVMQNENWKQYGCTLTVAVVTDCVFVTAALGDSFIVLQTSDDKLTLVRPPSVGEFANVTSLITSREFMLSTVYGNIDGLKTFALCSDAFESSTLKNKPGARVAEPFEGFWNVIFENSRKTNFSVKDLVDFMLSKNQLDDDTTMLLVSKIGNSVEEPSIVCDTFTYTDFNGWTKKVEEERSVFDEDDPIWSE